LVIPVLSHRCRTRPAFSLADAVSFSVMSDRDIREAFTLDHHFTVAGFSAAA
jgi:predicted nucleic acid-binding protein